MISLETLTQLDSELLVGLCALAIGSFAALLGVWMDRDKSRPLLWAFALTALIAAATAVGLIQTWVDHYDTEAMEEDVARMLSTLVSMADRTGDSDLKTLVEEQLGRSSGDVAERMQSRLLADGSSAEFSVADAQEPTPWDMLADLPSLLDALGFELWVALAAVIVAGLAAILGVWIERDADAPPATATFLSLIILLAVLVGLAQTVADVAEGEQLEDDVANMLVALDAIAQKGGNAELTQFIAGEMQAQARANPEVLAKVRKTVAAEGGDGDALLARHLPAAELSGLGLTAAAEVARAAAPAVVPEPCDCPEPEPCAAVVEPGMLTVGGAGAELVLASDERRLVIVDGGLPTASGDAIEVTHLGHAYALRKTEEADGPTALHLDAVAAHGSILFGKNETAIGDDQMPQIERLASALSALSGVVRLRVEGHSDKAGSAAHNFKLSEDRAAAVAQALKDRLADPRFEITARGLGSSRPVSGSAPDAPEQRRVEIEVDFDDSP